MHRFLVLIVLLTNTLVAFAQNGVKGRVLEADGTPVIYAAVVLESAGKTVAGAMTGEEGSFLVQGAFNGRYLLKVSSIGYKDLKREITCTGRTKRWNLLKPFWQWVPAVFWAVQAGTWYHWP